MYQIPHYLRRAIRIRAVISAPLALLVKLDRLAAGRAPLRHLKRRLCTDALLRNRPHDLRDYIPCPSEDDRVSDHYIPLADEIKIMERCPRDCRPGELHRLKHSVRRQDSRPSHLYDDICEPRLFLLRRELIGDRPLRRRGILTDSPAQREVVHLYDHPVDIERKRPAHIPDLLDLRDDLVRRLHDLEIRNYPEPELFKREQALVVFLEIKRSGLVIEDEYIKPPRRADLRVELSQRPGGGVSRVREKSLAALLPLRVQSLKRTVRHIDLLRAPRRRKCPFRRAFPY